MTVAESEENVPLRIGYQEEAEVKLVGTFVCEYGFNGAICAGQVERTVWSNPKCHDLTIGVCGVDVALR